MKFFWGSGWMLFFVAFFTQQQIAGMIEQPLHDVVVDVIFDYANHGDRSVSPMKVHMRLPYLHYVAHLSLEQLAHNHVEVQEVRAFLARQPLAKDEAVPYVQTDAMFGNMPSSFEDNHVFELTNFSEYGVQILPCTPLKIAMMNGHVEIARVLGASEEELRLTQEARNKRGAILAAVLAGDDQKVQEIGGNPFDVELARQNCGWAAAGLSPKVKWPYPRWTLVFEDERS